MTIVIVFLIIAIIAVVLIIADFISALSSAKIFTSVGMRISVDFFVLIVCPLLYLLISFEYPLPPIVSRNSTNLHIYYLILATIIGCYFALYSRQSFNEEIQLFLLVVVLAGVALNLYYLTIR